MEGLVVEEMDLDFTFSELCGNEVNNNSIKKIGYKS